MVAMTTTTVVSIVILCFSTVHGMPQILRLPQLYHHGTRARRGADTPECAGNLTQYQQCAQAAISAYSTPLQHVFDRMRRGEPIGITPGGISSYCNEHTSMPNCMAAVPPQCRPDHTSEYELVRNAVSLGCASQDAILALQSHSCDATVDPGQVNENCLWGVIRQAVRDMGEAPFRRMILERTSDYCPYLRMSRDCISSALTQWCQNELTDVITPIIRELMNTSWEREFRDYGCATTSPSINQLK